MAQFKPQSSSLSILQPAALHAGTYLIASGQALEKKKSGVTVQISIEQQVASNLTSLLCRVNLTGRLAPQQHLMDANLLPVAMSDG